MRRNGTSGRVGVEWTEINQYNLVVRKQTSFDTRKELDKFLQKLERKDGFCSVCKTYDEAQQST